MTWHLVRRPARPLWYRRAVLGRQRLTNAALHQPVDEALVTQSHLGFRRVDIDIHVLGRHVEPNHRHRMPAAGQHRPVGLGDRMGQERATHPATIDEKRKILPVGAVLIGQRREAEHAPAALFQRRQRHQPAGDFRSVYGSNRVEQFAVAGCLERVAPVVRQRQGDVGADERERAERGNDVAGSVVGDF